MFEIKGFRLSRINIVCMKYNLVILREESRIQFKRSPVDIVKLDEQKVLVPKSPKSYQHDGAFNENIVH